MNQAILFNDDLTFNKGKQAWTFSGLIAGNKIYITIISSKYKENDEISSNTVFDWEEAVEDWLEDNEPNENHEIQLHI